MRFVRNTANSLLLAHLGQLFVRPLLVMLEEAATLGVELCETSAFTLATIETRDAVTVAMPVKYRKTPLSQLCTKIKDECTAAELHSVINIYDQQYSRLAALDYNLSVHPIPKMVSTLLSKYVYEKLFDNEGLWHAIKSPLLTRTIFHDNFRRDNNYPSSCPYCDLDTINSQGNFIIEHFLPRSKFPLLAVHPHNLFTACNSCNMATSGKGAQLTNPITTPYAHEIGSLINFEFSYIDKKISINNLPSRDDVGGFLDLLQLRKRYANENSFRQFWGRANAFIESVSGKGLNKTEMLEYARSLECGSVLNYALRSWVAQTHL